MSVPEKKHKLSKELIKLELKLQILLAKLELNKKNNKLDLRLFKNILQLDQL
jgi:hypothetical protein